MPSRPTRLSWLAPVVALLVHATYFPNGFTWLDHGDVELGRAVLPLGRLHEALFTRMGDTGFFRPMVVVLHSVCAAAFGTWAPGHHLASILLFAALVAVVPFFLGAFFRLGPREETIASLVVALHPLSCLVVGGLAYQQELLVTLFVLLAVGFHARARQTGGTAAVIGAVASTFAAAASKETAFVWVVALIAFWEFFVREAPDRAATPPTPPTAPRLWALEAAALAVVLALRTQAVPEIWRATSQPLAPSEWLGTRLAAFGRSAVELVSPLLPSMSDVAPIVPITHPAALAVITGTLALAIVALRVGLRRPLGRTVAILAIALAPALRIVPVPRFGSPHYALPATAALGVLVVLAARAAARRPSMRFAGGVVFTAWLIGSAISTLAGGLRFRDDPAFFGPELALDPDYPEAHSELGRYWLAAGDPDRAARELSAALRARDGVVAYVDASMTRVNLALACLPRGRKAEAEGLLLDARAGAPPSRLALIDYNRARLAAEDGRDDAVVAILSPYAENLPTDEPYVLLARSLGRLGRIDEARRALGWAVERAPESRRPALERLLQAARSSRAS
jgi:hypothetical protein